MSKVSTAKTSRPQRVRAPRTQPQERRRQLLDIAESLLEGSGSDALRMDTLASAAGVTRPVVYSHFDNRDALIIALLSFFVRICWVQVLELVEVNEARNKN